MADSLTYKTLLCIIFTLQIFGIASWELPYSPKTKSDTSDLLDLQAQIREQMYLHPKI